MQVSDLSVLPVVRKSGAESFHASGHEAAFTVLDFWQWNGSNLVGNALRGQLAEFLVACALGVAGGTRTEWDAYDLRTNSGLKVEVKSSAYLQSWSQSRLADIRFNIRPTLGWEAATNTSSTEPKRQADVYVFAHLKHQDKRTLDPTNLDQWDFYIVPTTVLDQRLPAQKQISLATLLALEPIPARYDEIAGVLERLFPPDGRGAS
jgi:hypothetical protein